MEPDLGLGHRPRGPPHLERTMGARRHPREVDKVPFSPRVAGPAEGDRGAAADQRQGDPGPAPDPSGTDRRCSLEGGHGVAARPPGLDARRSQCLAEAGVGERAASEVGGHGAPASQQDGQEAQDVGSGAHRAQAAGRRGVDTFGMHIIYIGTRPALRQQQQTTTTTDTTDTTRVSIQ